MSNRAWVTLATNDSYGLGALVLAHSLRRTSSVYPAVVLITPSVTEPMRERLRAVYAEVVVVDVLDSRDAAHLALLQRPELGITFTKIHCWNLTQYEKCVFLDADTLVVQNCDELFEREELSAAPDVGWPDCFNSGVFVFRPSGDTFSNLVKFASERGSFDGGDQGLLNSFFSDWAHGDINKHLPFLYNVTSAAFYSYLPALKQYGQNLKIIHFIGAVKPWLQQYNWESRSVQAPEHLKEFLQLWWDLFVAQVHAQLDTNMTGVAGNLARVVPGAPLQREAVDELSRRQGWEAGNIDYMGADSFDNIWAKISQTLSQSPASPDQDSEPQVPQEEAKPISSEPAPVEPEPVVEKELVSEVPAEKVAEVLVETKKVPELESERPESVAQSEPADAPLPSEDIEVPVPASEAAEVKPEEPIPVPAEAAVVEALAESVPVEAHPEPAQEIPVVAVEALKIDEPAPKPAESEPAPEPAAAKPAPSAPETAAPEPAVPVIAQPAAAQDPAAEAVSESVPAVVESKPEEPAKAEPGSDSPPLANTPSKEEIPAAHAAKSTEEGAQETRL